jgi:hypothetical protein
MSNRQNIKSTTTGLVGNKKKQSWSITSPAVTPSPSTQLKTGEKKRAADGSKHIDKRASTKPGTKHTHQVNKKYRKDHEDKYPLPPLPRRPKEISKRVRIIVSNITASSCSAGCIYERGAGAVAGDSD